MRRGVWAVAVSALASAIPALVVALMLAVGGAARARPSGPDIVQVIIAARQPAQATALRDNLLELFGRMDAIAWYRDARAIDPEQLIGGGATPDNVPAALAYVWIDVGVARPDRALVYLAGADRQHVLQRTVVLGNGFDEVAREEVSQIVASAVDTLRAGAPLRAAKVDDVLLTAPAPKPRHPWLTLGATGAAERWSDEQSAVPAFGLSAVLGRSSERFQPALWLTASYHSTTTTGPAVALALRGGSLALVALPGIRLGRWTALRAGIGAGLDLLSVKPTLGEGQAVVVRLDPPRWVTAPFARAAARLDLDLGSALLAFLAVTGDVVLNQDRYVVDHNGTAQAVYESSRFRPAVLVGIEGRIMKGEAQ